MRIAFAPLLIIFGTTVACNAIVGFGDLEKTPSGATDGSSSGKTDDDDDTTSSSSSGQSSSGTTSSSSSSSSGGVVKKCDVTKPFGTPVALTGPVNTTEFEDGGSLTSDELTIVFLRTTGSNQADLMIATRNTIDEAFGTPTTVAAPASPDVWPAGISGDGLTLYWSLLGNTMDIQMSKRATKTAAFVDKQSSPWMNNGYDEFRPSITADGAEMFFVSNKDTGNTKLHPFHSLKGGDGNFAAPVALNELKADGTEQALAISGDGLTVYLSSDRAGGLGILDVWTAHRDTRTASFGPVTNVPEASSTANDVPAFISDDGCRLYLSSDRAGNGDLFVATKPL